ncbi:hypothetical protein ACLVWU_01340 [Bdellovibrio sp. HCB290]|uniref:hypothetical protein n=1 Tax=Bdellovibrio sp. HCB290 TaxID=3394356 RepID=UPI0039B46295
MNKDLIVAFALGILVGWGVFKVTSPKSAPAPTEVAQGVSENEMNTPGPTERADEDSDAPQTPDMMAAANPSATPLAQPPTTPEEPPRDINLQLTEEAVDMLEENIAELHQSVTVERDNEGFVLHFDSPDNYFANIGLANNDRIPFTQFEEMRQNPETQELAGRIETILSNLEK